MQRSRFRLALLLGVLLIPPVAQAQDTEPEVFRPVRSDTSRPMRDILRDLEQARPAQRGESVKPREVPNRLVPESLRDVGTITPAADPFLQRTPSAIKAPPLGLSFDGYDNNDNITVAGGQVAPPDTNGDVGVDFYIQYINIGWSIFNKSDGTLAAGPFIGNSFWTGFGGICETDNAGDPVVLYDELAGRWVFSQFADPVTANGTQCFAISTTGDPLGPYNRYEFAVPGIDYPKIGIFTDGADHSGYYFTTNNFEPNFTGVSIMAVDRDAMIAGDPSPTFLKFDIGTAFFAVQPGHLEGTSVPPAGSCNHFIMGWDDEIFAGTNVPTDGYQTWNLCPDWDTPGDSVLSAATLVPSAQEWDQELCGFQECMPQPGTTQLLDTLSQFTMYRATQRYDAQHAPGEMRMVVALTRDVGANQAGLQWAELSIPTVTRGTGPTIVDEGGFAPDADNRWLPSIAMDVSGNIGIGYSKGSATMEPSIYYTGREPGDTAGELQAEAACVDGPGVQTGTERWVDYASMSVDPVDQCTFWYTSEYMAATSTFTWSTRVCSFTFASCGIDRVIVEANPDNSQQQVCAPGDADDISLDVSISTGATDAVTLASTAPAGFTTAFSANPVDPTPGTVTATISIDNTVSAGPYSFNITGDSGILNQGVQGVSLEVFTDVPDVDPTPVSPADGTLDLGNTVTLNWTGADPEGEYRVRIYDVTNRGAPPVVDETVTGFSFTTDPLDSGDYEWTVSALNICGSTAESAPFSFSVAEASLGAVLVVDDDDNGPDQSAFFTNSLTRLGITFDVIDTGGTDTGEPDAATMGDYSAVVWFTGDSFSATAGPSPTSETEISNYLDGGGCYLLSSQDYAFRVFGLDFGLIDPTTTFMSDYLGAGALVQDIGHTTATGAGVFDGLGPYVLDYDVAGITQGFNDELIPSTAGATAFMGDAGANGMGAGTQVTGGGFNAFWMGVGFGAIPTEADRDAVMSAALIDTCAVLDAVEAGALAGRVTINGTDIPISNALITIERAGGTASTTTDANGDYSFPTLTPGFYVVSIDAINTVEIPDTINVEVIDAQTTTLDFGLDASAIAMDTSTLIETVDAGDSVVNTLTVENLGSVTMDLTLATGGYALGLPDTGARTPADRNQVGRRSSGGLSAAVEAPEYLRGPTSVSAAPGEFFISAPYPGESALGITMSDDGRIWVADLNDGTTYIYNEQLLLQGSIPHPTGPSPVLTSGIAYDTVNGTIWWLDAFGAILVEGTTDGTATGNTIPVISAGLPAGVEYSPELDAFVFLDIANDDIIAIDRTGVVLPGYPAPQTSYDDGSGLFGNGLDVVGNTFDVLVGLVASEAGVSRSVLTDTLGNSVGGETPLGNIPDTFINDIVRSRTDPNGAVYIVGNSSSAIYATEPENLILGRQWATTDVETTTVGAGSSIDIDLTFDSINMPVGFFQSQLAAGGNFVNQVDVKALGLEVVGAPGLGVNFTAYMGTDNGDQCAAGGGSDVIEPNATQAVTFCLEVTNSGDSYFEELSVDIPELGVTQAGLATKEGTLPLAPADSILYFFVYEAPMSVSNIDANVSSEPTDGEGTVVPGGTQQTTGTVIVRTTEDFIFGNGFEEDEEEM